MANKYDNLLHTVGLLCLTWLFCVPSWIGASISLSNKNYTGALFWITVSIEMTCSILLATILFVLKEMYAKQNFINNN